MNNYRNYTTFGNNSKIRWASKFEAFKTITLDYAENNQTLKAQIKMTSKKISTRSGPWSKLNLPIVSGQQRASQFYWLARLARLARLDPFKREPSEDPNWLAFEIASRTRENDKKGRCRALLIVFMSCQETNRTIK